MNETDLGPRVASHLDQGVEQLPAAVLYRLRAAREAALAHAREPALTHVGLDTLAGGPGARRIALPLAALGLVLLMMFYWQSLQQTSHNGDVADLDADVLTDDLPVRAYLDQGFEVWLYHQTPPAAEQ
jgi:hypothetical protein